MCAAYVYGNQVAIRVNDEFQTYEIDESGRQIGNNHTETLRYEDLHPEATPAGVYEAPYGQWTLRSVSSVFVPAPTPTYTTFSEYVQMLPPWEVDLFQHVHLSLDPAYVCFDPQM
jgi:hypothetical protein